MTPQLDKNIERFARYFRNQLREIQALKTDNEKLYQRLLYLSFLDSLAGVAFSQPEYKNRDRFVSFIKNFCEWPDGDRVSIPHLAQLLQKTSDSEYRDVQEWVTDRLNAPALDGTIVAINQDPLLEEVKSRWPNLELSVNLDGKKRLRLNS